MRRLPESRPFGAVVVVVVMGVAVLAAAASAATAAPTRATKLSPAEQKWVQPLLSVWAEQNAGLSLVLGQAARPNAFLLGSTPNNAKLQTILGALLSCKKPKDRIKTAGTPPTARLQTFVTALDAGCALDEKGAHAFSRAMITETANETDITTALIKQGIADFTAGSKQIKKAYTSVISIGARLKA